MSAPTTSTSWMNGMSRFTLRRLLVRGVPLRARLALLLDAQLGAMLVADVPEPRPARGVLAAFHPAAHVQPAAAFAGACQPRGGLVRLRPLEQDALLLLDGYAPGMVAAEPAVARARSGVLASGRRTHAQHGGSAEATAPACRGAREHLFRAQRDC